MPDALLEKFETWVQQYGPQVSNVTARKYRSACQEFEKKFGHPVYADSGTYQQWYESLRTHLKPNTINLKIAALRALGQYLRERKIRTDDPMQGIRMQRVPDRLPRPITHKEVRQVLEYLAGLDPTIETLQDMAIVEILYGSGLRREEAGRLALGHFVDQDTLRFVGKGDKERITILTDPAYEAVRNLVLFPETSDTAFWALVRDHPARAVFWTRTGRAVPTLKDPGHFIYTRWLEVSQAAGVQATPHRLRHGFGTRLWNGGADLAVVQLFMGHEDIRTTRRYAGLERARILAAKAAHARQRDGR